VATVALAAASGAVGFAVGRTTDHGHASTARTTTPQGTVPPTTTPALTTTSPEPTSTSPTTAPVGPAGSFAGQWIAHSALLMIHSPGYGILDWRTYKTCGHDPPPCDIIAGNDIINGGHATFSLAARGPTTASGEVLTTTVPHDVPIGRFTARLDPATDLLHLSVPLFLTNPLCGPNAATARAGLKNPAECWHATACSRSDYRLHVLPRRSTRPVSLRAGDHGAVPDPEFHSRASPDPGRVTP
jgi:hypothetical protein